MTYENGFTLLEVLLVIAIIGVIFMFSAVVFDRLQVANDLSVAQQSYVQALRQSQQFSRSSIDDSDWGVELQSGSITVFMGASYATRNTAYDETTSISPSIAISGITQVVFDRVTALPNNTGDTSMVNNNVARTTTINAEGTILY